MTAEPRVVIFDFGGVLNDSPHNVDAAIALGIHGIHFRSPPALRAELIALGLLG